LTCSRIVYVIEEVFLFFNDFIKIFNFSV